MSKRKDKKIICAMSGGIDSSVAGALLKRAGFDVIGVFMRFWSKKETKQNNCFNRCCCSESEKRARYIADLLSIPFYVVDVRKEFKKEVVDYFISEFKKGKTPNPCIVCNKKIKFGVLLEKAFSLGFEFVATGHYARKKAVRDKKSNQIIYKLLKAKDKNKDQSYFLWKLNQKQLAHILFPIGKFTKTEVKRLASRFKLSKDKKIRQIPESQEICFIADSLLEEFLSCYIQSKPGKIVDLKGKELGKHRGLIFYTIGQRKGIRLAGGPYYVVSKETKKNVLVVSKDKKDLLRKELLVQDVNWISGKKPAFPLKAKVKIRYKHKGALAVIRSYKKGLLKIIFLSPQEAITPGQSAVFYRREEVLGGGIIY